MSLSLFAQIGLLAHLFSLLVPALGEQLAGFAAGSATAAAIAGRTLVGWLMPAGADRRLFSGGNCILQIMGSLAFLFAAGGNVPLLFLGILLFGAGIGNNTSLPPLIAARSDAAATLADDGRIIVTGGRINGVVSNSVEALNPASGSQAIAKSVRSRFDSGVIDL